MDVNVNGCKWIYIKTSDGGQLWWVVGYRLYAVSNAALISDFHIVIKWDQTLSHSFLYAEISLTVQTIVVRALEGWHPKNTAAHLQDVIIKRMNLKQIWPSDSWRYMCRKPME